MYSNANIRMVLVHDNMCFFIFYLCVCSLVGSAHAVNSGEAHQQGSRQKQEPPQGDREAVFLNPDSLDRQTAAQQYRLKGKSVSYFNKKTPFIPIKHLTLFVLVSPAQDGPSHQHLLQRGEAALAAGQRGRGPSGSAERARHVRDSRLLDHLGEESSKPATLLTCLCSLKAVTH